MAGMLPIFVSEHPKCNPMEKILLVKEIYIEAFRNWTSLMLKRYFKAFSWFCFGLWLITMYAFVFRVSTGFAFD
jgi:hypothetical protein